MGALSNKCAVARGFFLGDLMKFNPGELVVTPKVVKSVEPKKLLQAFGRYRDGDWGDLPPEDIAANNEALKIGERLIGKYDVGAKEAVYIITEADRSVTTILFCSEY